MQVGRKKGLDVSCCYSFNSWFFFYNCFLSYGSINFKYFFCKIIIDDKINKQLRAETVQELSL